MAAPRLFALLLLCLAPAAGVVAQLPRSTGVYTRFLLPFHATMSAGTGTWFVDWWFRNEGDTPADVFPLAFNCGLPPPPGPDGPRAFVIGRPALPANTTLTCLVGDVLPSTPVAPSIPIVSSSVGAFVHVEAAAAQQVNIAGSVRWFSPGRTAVATPLRPVPEASFLAGRRSIMPVPVTSGRRYAIRVYALPESLGTGARAELRVYEMQPRAVATPQEQFLYARPIELAVPDSRVRPCLNACDVPPAGFVPAVAQLFDVPVPEATGRFSTLRFEIVPESPDLRWWAIVSATDNVSQEIALYEPVVSLLSEKLLNGRSPM